MSDLTIKGAVKLVNEVKVISDRFSVREFVITTLDPKYPQDILFQAVNDKMDAVAPLRKSQVVEVSFNLRGREFNGRYYNTLDVWKVTHDKEFVDPASKPTAPVNEPMQMDDDLPF
jgi:hypothetical protein